MTQPYSPATSPFTPDPAAYAPKLRIPIGRKGHPLVVAGSDVTPGRIALASVTTGIPLGSVEAQQALFLAAACPMSYDGARVHEMGFNYYPEVAVSSQQTGGSLTIAGAYGFIFVYEWQDAQGMLWRSAPSAEVLVTLTASNTSVTFQVAPMLLTDKQDADSDLRNAIRLVCYRTTAGQTIYYRDIEIDSNAGVNKVSNGSGSDLFKAGGFSDANIARGENLYTTGDVLENDAFPSISVCCTHQRRIFMVTQNDQNFLQYTDEIDELFLAPATNNDVYRIPIPSDGGSVVGLASMDDKLIIFCQHRIYYIFGEGPNRLGTANGYSLPQICSSKMGALGGCAEALALTPEGLWFLSSTGGLRLLTRGLSIGQDENGTYLGVEADGLVPITITRIQSASVDAKNQVRWYLSDGTVVIWDYQQRQWSHFSNHDSAGGAVSARGLFWHSDGTNLFSSNTAAGGNDDATVTPMVAETAWMALADVQGFQRIFKLLLLGQAMSACRVDVAVGYDYDETWIDGATALQGTVVASGTRMKYSSATGPFSLNETITGLSSGATGRIAYAYSDFWIIDTITGTFTDIEGVEGSASFPFPTAQVVSLLPRVAIVSGLPAAPVANQVITGLTSGSTGRISSATVATGAPLEYAILVASDLTGSFTAAETVAIKSLFRYTVTEAVNPLQLEHPLHKQQCEAVRFRITITPSSTSEAVRLTNFGLTVGLKKGTHKFASSKRF